MISLSSLLVYVIAWYLKPTTDIFIERYNKTMKILCLIQFLQHSLKRRRVIPTPSQCREGGVFHKLINCEFFKCLSAIDLGHCRHNNAIMVLTSFADAYFLYLFAMTMQNETTNNLVCADLFKTLLSLFQLVMTNFCILIGFCK